MRSSLFPFILAALALHVAKVNSAFTFGKHDHSHSSYGGSCGIHPTQIASTEEHFQKHKGNRLSDSHNTDYAWATIAINFHIVGSNQTVLDIIGRDERIEAQMKVLDEAYAPARIQWKLANVTRTINETWWAKTGEGLFDEDPTRPLDANPSEREMKESLSARDSSVLDVFVVDLVPGPSLGGYVRTLPGWYADDPKHELERDQVDGVILNWNALPLHPQPSAAEIFTGKVLVHEVGHWMGLLHTFGHGHEAPGSCEGPGDYVDDTPTQAYATHGQLTAKTLEQCIPQDSCPDIPGLDSINNYMDYAPEVCQHEFTPGQIWRLRALLDLYRQIPAY
ncbi:hypothetical protein FA15DRAFT_693890 [Coprinopsis marcescibilis]|uniref:Peptidase M43 pregnancy-associated plasma-A domain-containing protein n=1 Tax=Coprinopsis marcescibilis TaxID=230819 RepID=A0A5C3KYC1_COPMA|nr:hypothetical protein FA15DRAFT_693890 [Coprinopsis marcescibilis]